MKKEEPQNKRFLQTLQEKIYNINTGYEIDNENKSPPKLSQNLQNEDKLEEEKLNEEKEKLNEEAEKIDDEDDKKMEEEEKIEKEEEEIEEGEEKEEKEEKEINEEEKEEEINEEKIYEKQIYEERIYEDKNPENINNFSPEITPKNISLKESIPYPIESQNIQNEESIKINLNEKNNRIINSPYNQNFTSIKSALCKLHGQLYIKLNPINFEIMCEKCLEEGKISQIEIKNNYNENNEEDKLKYNCFEHQNIKGSFYCDYCKQFVCKKCFADLHKEHKCHLPKVIKNEFVELIKEEIEDTIKLKPILNDSINDIKKIYENLKGQKDDIMKVPNNTFKVISLNNDNEMKLLMKKANDQFMGIDSDVYDNYTYFNIIKEKSIGFMNYLKKISDEMNNKKNNFLLCRYHKKKIELLNEINNFINSSFNFINETMPQTNDKFSQNTEKIEKSLILINKEISKYQKNCISSIISGRQNRSIVLLRFNRYIHKEIKYFKNSLIAFATNDNIFLTGLVLCGLHIKRKNNLKRDENKKNEDINSNEINSDENEIKSKENNIPIQITIFTMVNKLEGNKLISQKFELNGVKTNNEPYIFINFEKGVNIIKEKLYIIKVENLSDNNYNDLWIGSIGKNNKGNMQVIACHNSGIHFLFKKTEGIQTDFDEFEQGIISGILYSFDK